LLTFTQGLFKAPVTLSIMKFRTKTLSNLAIGITINKMRYSAWWKWCYGETFMLSVEHKSFMQSIVKLNVVMLSLMYAEGHLCWVSFMLRFIFAECHLCKVSLSWKLLCWVSCMLRVIYAECHLCRVSIMLIFIYAECHLCWVSSMLSVICWVSFMPSVIYAECHLCWVPFMLCAIYVVWQISPLCRVSLCWILLCWLSLSIVSWRRYLVNSVTISVDSYKKR